MNKSKKSNWKSSTQHIFQVVSTENATFNDFHSLKMIQPPDYNPLQQHKSVKQVLLVCVWGFRKTLEWLKRPAARFGGNRHWGFSLHSKANTKRMRFPCQNSKRYTTDPKHKKGAQNHINKPYKFLFCGAMKQYWCFSALWINSMSGGRRMKHLLQLSTVKHGGAQWCSVTALHPLALETCGVWKARWIHWSIRKS